ncbi:MAG: VOC family protein [Chloroflexota bacterium]
MADVTFKRTTPVLASLDLSATEAWYKEKMGFDTWAMHPNYLIMYREGFLLHFWLTDNKAFAENTSCYVDVEGIDAWYEACQEAEIVHPNGTLQNHDYGMREFSILDLHGNLIRFGQPVDES